MDRNKIKLAAMMLTFFVPISLATYTFMKHEGQGFAMTSNKGTLISPVLDITDFELQDASGQALFKPFEESVAGIDPSEYDPRPWMLLYLGASNCDEQCEERLYFLRQLHRRLGGEAGRVSRYYAVVGDGLPTLDSATEAHFAEILPDMVVAGTEAEALRTTLQQRHEGNEDPIADHYIYVVDPVGNVMLYFTPANSPEDILSDLDKLLDQSSLG